MHSPESSSVLINISKSCKPAIPQQMKSWDVTDMPVFGSDHFKLNIVEWVSTAFNEQRENFILQGRLSVLTLISVSVPPPCYRSST